MRTILCQGSEGPSQNDSVDILGVRFAPSEFIMFLQDCIVSKSNLVLVGARPHEVDRFCYSGSCTLSGDRMSDEVSSGMQKARLTFVYLGHLWRRCDILLVIKSPYRSTAPKT